MTFYIKILLYLASKGFYYYDGDFNSLRSMKLPQGYVLYNDGYKSRLMPLGNCFDYAKLFGGKVIYVGKFAYPE
jgi:hypothetical protein